MMKKSILTRFILGAAGACALFCACSDSNDSDNPFQQTDDQLRAAVNDYIDHTVLPTYKAMADAAVSLADQCNEIKTKSLAGTLTADDVRRAGDTWRLSRKSWELSEAFLYGPAANHNIDPHIDSWPLDKVAMDDLLADIRAHKPDRVPRPGVHAFRAHTR